MAEEKINSSTHDNDAIRTQLQEANQTTQTLEKQLEVNKSDFDAATQRVHGILIFFYQM